MQIAAGVAAIPFLVCGLGMALFVPYNLLAYNGMIPQAASLYAILFALAGLVFVFHFRKPAVRRDRLLMVFPLVYVVGHLYIYVAKFDLYFSLDASGLTRDGLAAGNLVAAVMAMVGSLAITLLSHPAE